MPVRPHLARTVRTLSTLALLALPAVAADAASQAELTITGTIPLRLGLAVEPEPAAATLDPAAGADGLAVATVIELSNSPGGFTVTVGSDHGGRLLGTGDASGASVAYTLDYGGRRLDLGGGPVAVSRSGKTPPEGMAVPLRIDFPPSFVPAGDYQDTVQLTIAAD